MNLLYQDLHVYHLHAKLLVQNLSLTVIELNRFVLQLDHDLIHVHPLEKNQNSNVQHLPVHDELGFCLLEYGQALVSFHRMCTYNAHLEEAHQSNYQVHFL